MFELIRKFYKMHLYNEEKVRQFFEGGVITEEEYREIVREKD